MLSEFSAFLLRATRTRCALLSWRQESSRPGRWSGTSWVAIPSAPRSNRLVGWTGWMVLWAWGWPCGDVLGRSLKSLIPYRGCLDGGYLRLFLAFSEVCRVVCGRLGVAKCVSPLPLSHCLSRFLSLFSAGFARYFFTSWSYFWLLVVGPIQLNPHRHHFFNQFSGVAGVFFFFLSFHFFWFLLAYWLLGWTCFVAPPKVPFPSIDLRWPLDASVWRPSIWPTPMSCRSSAAAEKRWVAWGPVACFLRLGSLVVLLTFPDFLRVVLDVGFNHMFVLVGFMVTFIQGVWGVSSFRKTYKGYLLGGNPFAAKPKPQRENLQNTKTIRIESENRN